MHPGQLQHTCEGMARLAYKPSDIREIIFCSTRVSSYACSLMQVGMGQTGRWSLRCWFGLLIRGRSPACQVLTQDCVVASKRHTASAILHLPFGHSPGTGFQQINTKDEQLLTAPPPPRTISFHEFRGFAQGLAPSPSLATRPALLRRNMFLMSRLHMEGK